MYTKCDVEGKLRNLSVSSGTMSRRILGLNSRAFFTNLFAREALTPKGGLRPITFPNPSQDKKLTYIYKTISNKE